MMAAGAEESTSLPLRSRLFLCHSQNSLGQGSGFFNLFRDDICKIAAKAEIACEYPVDQPLIAVDITGDDLKQIVKASPQRPTGDDFVIPGHRLFKGAHAFGAMVFDLGNDEDRDMRCDLAQFDLGSVAGDDPGLFEPLQPFPAWRGAQVDPGGEFRLGDPPLPGQNRQDAQVAIIELQLGHGAENARQEWACQLF